MAGEQDRCLPALEAQEANGATTEAELRLQPWLLDVRERRDAAPAEAGDSIAGRPAEPDHGAQGALAVLPSRARRCVSVLLLALLSAAGALLLTRRPAAPPPHRAEPDGPLMQAISVGQQENDEPLFPRLVVHPEGRDRLSRCVGSALAASLWTANLGLQVAAAVHDCPVLERLKEIALSQDPFSTSTSEESRRLAESVDPATRGAWLRMVAAKRQAWDAERDNATAEAFRTFLRQQRADLKALCARDVLEFFSGSAVLAALLQNAATDCGATRAKYNSRCGKNVASAINRFTRASRFASQMEAECPRRSKDFRPDRPQPSVTFGCGDRLEGVAWSLGPMGRDVGRAAFRCAHPHSQQGWGPLDVGACVTQIASAAAYLGSTALSLATASRDDCVGVTAEDLDLAGRALDGEEAELRSVLAEERRLRRLACARDIISSTRTLGLAAERATEAAGHCGGRSTRCGKDVAFTATALAAVAEAAVLAVRRCRRSLNATASDERLRRIECTRQVGSSLKELSVVAALAIDAAASCRNSTAAVGVCGSGIGKTLAAFGYLLERTALAARNCPDEARYSCGVNFAQDGQALQVASLAVAGAAINCGLGLAARLTPPVPLPRRFWVPS